MLSLRDAIPPSETVLWRWPAPWKAADALGWFAFYAVGGAAGWAAWAGVIEDKFWSGAAWTLATPAAASAAGKAFSLLGALLWGRRAVAVTGQRIVVATGRIQSRTQTVYREAIHGASLYEGDETLILQGRDAELLRLERMGKDRAAELLALLDVPTAVWGKRKPSQPVRAIRSKALAGTLTFWAALAGVGVAVAGPGTIADMAVSGFHYLSGSITFPGAVVAALAGGGAALFALAVAQLMMHDYLAVAIARHRGPPEVLRELISAAGDPLWRGWPREPAKAAKVSDIMESLNGWAKFLGALPVEPIPLEPEYRDFRAEAEAEP